MIFSNERIARALESDFECVWRSVGPVPQVRIEFGNSEVLETTLGGNVLTSFCLPDGSVFDVLPGVISADAYLSAAQEAAQFARRTQPMTPEQRALAAGQYPLLDERALAWHGFVEATLNTMASSAPGEVRSLDALEPFGLFELPAPLPTLNVALSKSVIIGELPLVDRLRAKPLSSLAESLAADTILNESVLRPQARAVLGALTERSHEAVTPHVFRLVLQIDLEDPYLGLGDAYFGKR